MGKVIDLKTKKLIEDDPLSSLKDTLKELECLSERLQEMLKELENLAS